MTGLNNAPTALSPRATQFRLDIEGLPVGALAVQRYRSDGFELSSSYTLHIAAVARNAEVSADELVGRRATLWCRWEGGETPIHGSLGHAACAGGTPDGSAYSLLLQSPLAPLALNRHNRVFLGEDAQGVVAEVLKSAGFDDRSVRFQLRNRPGPREFVAQYDESDLAFVQRQLAYHGLVYAFAQEADRAVLVISDDVAQLAAMLGTQPLDYQALSGQARLATTVYAWERRVELGTARVRLKDYNPEAPNQPLVAEAEQGEGPTDYRYGEAYADQSEGDRLAAVRCEAHAGSRDTVVAETDCRALHPGMRLALSGHPQPENDGEWTVIAVDAQGDQRNLLPTGDGGSSPAYQACLLLVRAGVPYRVPTVDSRRRVHGMFTARVEGDGGDYAYIDDQGRYRVRLPFDLGDAPDGEASHPLRLMHPYGGADYGMHFPLHHGTEVLVACVNGDVDRPVLVGALNNAAAPSPVTAANATQNVLRTWAGNELVMEDKAGEERITLAAAGAANRLRLDAATDDPRVDLVSEEGDMELRAGKSMSLEAGRDQTVDVGGDQTVTVKDSQRLMTRKGKVDVQAAEDCTLKAGGAIRFEAEAANIEARAGKDMVISSGGTCSMEVRRGDATVLVNRGGLSIQAARDITVRGDGEGSIRIGQAGGQIEIGAGGDLTINAPTVEITGDSIKVSGKSQGNN
jgi:type VI secretion system secreted protein VgrG